ncbi:hypothetical protein TrLO_g8573 [Triparma laevis f. longispina]|uniref:GrpE protein homolog n=1 Tax=Triparma laevis f. longispina TaxID=1714387 RepID=A0A9W7FK42_9STRA|nr:hypothetical protein TrLO_g8573 [Triparma laevis f. longispina]
MHNLGCPCSDCTGLTSTALFAKKKSKAVDVSEEDDVKETEVVAETEVEEENKEEEEKEGEIIPEDPEVTALKAEIKSLESQISTNQLKTTTLKTTTSTFSKDAYVRLAAEFDNYKRKNVDRGKDTGYVEQANILKSFLPIYDKLVETSEEYSESKDEDAVKTAKSYSALGSNLMIKFKELGVKDTHGVVGEKFKPARHEKVKEVHSDEVGVGCVVEEVEVGLELKDNIVRKSKVVISLGVEGGDEVEKEVVEDEDEEKEEEVAVEEPVAETETPPEPVATKKAAPASSNDDDDDEDDDEDYLIPKDTYAK